MPNLMDYLTWRGDLPLETVALCEVDFLLFAQFAYVALGDCVPRDNTTVGEAADALLACDPDAEWIPQTSYLWKDNLKMLEAVINCKRFRSVPVTRRVDELTDDTQFSALTFHPCKGVSVVAFRGTDATFVGWEEDFRLALDKPVPAQLRAREYLQVVAEETDGDLYLVGHSKGGNLAIYSAATVGEGIQARVRGIYNFDGPGFPHGLIGSEGYLRVRDRLRVYRPQGSVIGMLLEHEAPYAIVQARSVGLMQHNAFTWQLSGREFVRADHLTQTSSYVAEVTHDWLEQLDNEQRAEFIEAVFAMLRALDVDSVSDVNVRLVTRLPAIIGRMISIPNEQKRQLFHSLMRLGGAAITNLVQPALDLLNIGGRNEQEKLEGE